MSASEYLKKRAERNKPETSATKKAGGVSTKSKTVKSYLKEREEEGRYRKDAVSSLSYDWEERKKELGIRTTEGTKKTRTVEQTQQAKPQYADLIAEYNKTHSTTGEIYNTPKVDKSQYIKKGEERAAMKDIVPNTRKDVGAEQTPLNRSYMEQSEKDIYNYMLGRYGKTEAENYAKSIEATLNKRMTEGEAKKAREVAKGNMALGTALNAAASLAGGVGALNAVDKKIESLITGENEGADIYSESFIPQAMMQGTSEGIKDRIGGTKTKDFLIDTGLSITQNLARLPLGSAGLAVAGLGAASSAYQDARLRGASENQALLSGLAQGLTEAAFEKIPLDNLRAFRRAPAAGVKQFAKNIGKQAAVEATEEALTELTNSVTDKLIMGERSNYDAYYNKAIEEGLSPEEARETALRTIGQNTTLSGLAGGLSGGLMGTGAQTLSNYANYASEYARRAQTGTQEAQTNVQDIQTDIQTEPQDIQADIQTDVQEIDTQDMQTEQQAIQEPQDIQTEPPVIQTEMQTELPVIPEPTNTQDVQNEPQEEISWDELDEEELMKQWEPDLRDYVEEYAGVDTSELEEIFEDLGEAGRKEAARQYDDEIELPVYRKEWNRIYDMGRYGFSGAIESAEDISSPVLTDRMVNAAFRAGIKDRTQGTLSPTGEKRKGNVILESHNASDAQVELAKKIGTKTGLTIILTDRSDGVSGSYKKGEVRISVHSENFAGSLSHELTHFIKDYAPEHYDAYRTCIYENLQAKGSLDSLYASYEANYKRHGKELNRDEIMDEIIADSAVKVLGDADFIEQVVKNERSLAQKIVDFLSDIIDSLKELVNSSKGNKVTEILETYEGFKSNRKMWLNALEEASENNKAGMEMKEIAEKYQIDDFEEIVDIQALIDENKELKDLNENLRNQLILTKDYKPRKEDIRNYAKELLRQNHSDYSLGKLEEKLSRLYEHIGNLGELTESQMEDVQVAASAIAREVLSKSQWVDVDLQKKYKKMLELTRGTTIYLSPTMISEINYTFGQTYEEFRRANFGRLTLTKTNKSACDPPTAMQQLAEKMPGDFQLKRDSLNDFDVLCDLLNTLDKAKESVYMEINVEEEATGLGLDIIENRANIRNIPKTMADKLMDKADKTEQQAKELIDEYKEKKKTYRAEVAQRVANRKYKEEIVRNVTQMQRWLLQPTDKEHIPEKLRLAATKFLSCIDYSSNHLNQFGEPTKRTKDWNEAKDIYEAILKANAEADDDLYIELDPNMAENMKEVIAKVENIGRMEDLDSQTLLKLRNIVCAMKQSITTANILHTNARFETVEAAAKEQIDTMRQRTEYKTIKEISSVDKFMRVHMLDSITMFDRLGPAAKSMYDAMRKGFDQKIADTRAANEYMEKLKKENGITQETLKKWSGKNAEKTTYKVRGGSIELTPAEVMSIYCLNKRAQARGHLYNQNLGIRTARKETDLKVAGKKVATIQTETQPVAVTPTDVAEIILQMQDEQKKVADGIMKFFEDYTTVWGNEVSMMLYGYKKFNAKNYFPIVVDSDSIKTDSKKLGNGIEMLRNLGFTKSTTKKAKNALMIEDIFDVYTRQANQMGSYHSFVVPISDFMKFYNYIDEDAGNIKTEIKRVFGSEAQSYIQNFMSDLNGVGTGERELTSPLMGNVKAAAVGANLRTVIQQPTAIIRAMTEIDAKYLTKGITSGATADEWEECLTYAPIAWWKSNGNFDIDTGRSMKSTILGAQSLRETLTEKGMEPAGKADEWAWKRLWKAVKEEASDLHPELSGEELLKHCGERFSEIIDKTQVVDSVFHRTWAMRQKWTKMYTAFMSEPSKVYNMIYRASADAILSKQKDGKVSAECAKKLRLVGTAYILSNTATALAASVIDAIRNDDDDKNMVERYLYALLGENGWDGNLGETLSPVQMVPILKDAWNMLSGFSAPRMDMQGIQQLVYLYNELEKFAKGESNYTAAGMIEKTLKPISMLSGVPVSNLQRDASGLINTVFDITNASTMDYLKDRGRLDIKKPGNTQRYAKAALRAYLDGKQSLGDKIINDLVNAGIEKDSIDSRLLTEIKKDERIIAAAEARLEGNYESYESYLKDVQDDGIDKDLVIRAAASLAGRTGMYSGTDVEMAIRDMDIKNKETVDAVNRAAGKLIEEKIAEGKTEKDAISSLKSSLTGKFKKEYLELKADERSKLKLKLQSVKYKGKRIYSDKDFVNWAKK